MISPGRELDVKVAKEVLGCDAAFVTGTAAFCRCRGNPHGEPPIGGGLGSLKRYSMQIGAAWELVEAGFVESVVRVRGNRWHARSAKTETKDWEGNVIPFDDRWHEPNGYYEIPIYEKDGDVLADTAPHAICLAALKAVGQKVDR